MSDLRLAWVSHESALAACKAWHYSKSMPSSKTAKVGVWEDGIFIGAVVFGMGANRKLVNPYGFKPWEGCELCRVALNKHKAPVSKIVSIAMRMVKKANPGLQLVISYADPAQGHHGGIYQAMNWVYLGQSEPDKFPVIDGKVVHPRTLSSAIGRGSLKSRKNLVYVRTPGKHRYGYGLTSKGVIALESKRKPYPTKAAEMGKGITPDAPQRFDSDSAAPEIGGSPP